MEFVVCFGSVRPPYRYLGPFWETSASQATEPSVDMAMERKIPFAVCPCCVFPMLISKLKAFGISAHAHGHLGCYFAVQQQTW